MVKPSPSDAPGVVRGCSVGGDSGRSGGVGKGCGLTPVDAHAEAIEMAAPSAMPASARTFMPPMYRTVTAPPEAPVVTGR